MEFIKIGNVNDGSPDIEIGIRRTRAARRLSLRISQLDGRVVMSIPKRTSLREARKFATEQASWIATQLARQPDQVRPAIGKTVLFQGQEVEIVAGKGRAVRFLDGQILVPPRPETVAPRLAAFYKTEARTRLAAASDHYAAQLGVTYGRLTLRDTRSRWGSCSSAGNLMYSWRLIMAPPDVLNYVAAHEVSHLLEMNHSPAYWTVVAKIFPNFKAPRQWLRENGSQLHKIRFKD